MSAGARPDFSPLVRRVGRRQVSRWAGRMARKLKSDRVLFTATLLLVCASIVMVYSASALVALERFDQPYLLPHQAGAAGRCWAWRSWRSPCGSTTGPIATKRSSGALLALVGLMLVAVMFSRPVNGTRRWFGIGGLGIQPSELAKVACVLFTALMLERRMHRIDEAALFAPPDRHRGRRPARPDPAAARLRHGCLAAAHRRGDGLCRRPATTGTWSARRWPSPPVIYSPADASRYRWHRLIAFLEPVGRSAGRRLPDRSSRSSRSARAACSAGA